jgi:hypothetical protein
MIIILFFFVANHVQNDSPMIGSNKSDRHGFLFFARSGTPLYICRNGAGCADTLLRERSINIRMQKQHFRLENKMNLHPNYVLSKVWTNPMIGFIKQVPGWRVAFWRDDTNIFICSKSDVSARHDRTERRTSVSRKNTIFVFSKYKWFLKNSCNLRSHSGH